MEISPKFVELVPSGHVLFYQDRTGPLLLSTRWTTEVRRVTSGAFANKLWISYENSSHEDVYIDVTTIEEIESPGPVIQAYASLGDTPEPADVLARIDDIFEYLVLNIFRGCCDGGTPIPGPYFVKTYAEWDVIRLAGQLPKGLWVGVTDIPSQPGAIFTLFCQEVDAFALGGFGTFLNADWQGVGDYSGVVGLTGVAFTSNIGQWYVGLEGSAADGDVVIYNCLHFQVIDDGAFNGTDPTVNTTAYAALPITTADMGYVSEVDDIEFDFVADWLQYRADKRGNTYRYSKETDDVVFGLGFTAINLFQWGRVGAFGWLIDGSHVSVLNILNTITGGVVVGSSTIENIVNEGQIEFIICQDNGRIDNLVVDSGGAVQHVFCNNSTLTNVVLPAGSSLLSISVKNAGLFANKSISGAIEKINITSLSQQFTESLSARSNITHIPGQSNDFRPLDVTGGGTIDIGSNAELVGIYNCSSSNAAETITQFDNPPLLFPFTIKPDAGLIITIAFTPIGSLAANYEIVDATSTLVLDGDNGDSATFEIQTIGGFDVLVLTEAIQNT